MEWKIISKLQSKGGLIAVGVISMISSMLLLIYRDHWIHNTEWNQYVICLEIVASAILIGGALKGSWKLYVPWLIITVFFISMIIYKIVTTTSNFSYMSFDQRMTIIFFIIYIPAMGFFFIAWWAVESKFEELRKEEPPSYNSVSEKVDSLSVI